MSALSSFRRRLMSIKRAKDPLDEPIIFEDANVKSVLVAKWGGRTGGNAPANTRINGVFVHGKAGELTYRQAQSVIKIGSGVFDNNTSITKFNEFEYFINCHIINDGNYGFANCSNLQSINLVNITDVNANAFINCSSLVNLGDTSNIVTMGANSFRGANQSMSTTISFPSLESFENDSFPQTISFEYVLMPKIVRIPANGINTNTRNSIISIGDTPNLTTVGNDAFNNGGDGGNLLSINLSACTSIGSAAFAHCKKLKNLTVGNITVIQSYTFGYMNGLEWIKFTSPSLITLNNVNGLQSLPCDIYVPDDLVDSYKVANNWSTYAAKIKPMSQWAIDFPN
jgi:hypothetical protein